MIIMIEDENNYLYGEFHYMNIIVYLKKKQYTSSVQNYIYNTIQMTFKYIH